MGHVLYLAEPKGLNRNPEISEKVGNLGIQDTIILAP